MTGLDERGEDFLSSFLPLRGDPPGEVVDIGAEAMGDCKTP
jgi:hypothetical protein